MPRGKRVNCRLLSCGRGILCDECRFEVFSFIRYYLGSAAYQIACLDFLLQPVVALLHCCYVPKVVLCPEGRSSRGCVAQGCLYSSPWCGRAPSPILDPLCGTAMVETLELCRGVFSLFVRCYTRAPYVSLADIQNPTVHTYEYVKKQPSAMIHRGGVEDADQHAWYSRPVVAENACARCLGPCSLYCCCRWFRQGYAFALSVHNP